MRCPALACALTTLTCGLAAHAVPPISQLTDASRTTFIAEIPSTEALIAAAKDSRLYDLFLDPRVENFLQAIWGEAEMDLDDTLDRLGLDRADLQWPTGRVGVATFYDGDVTAALAGNNVAFFDADSPLVGLVIAEFGPNIDKAEASLETLIDFCIENELLRFDHADEDDEVVTLRSLVFERQDQWQRTLDDEYRRRLEAVQDGDWEARSEVFDWYYDQISQGFEPTGDKLLDTLSSLLANREAFAYCRLDDALILGDTTSAVAAMFDAARVAPLDPVADAPFYTDALALLGQDLHAWVVANTRLEEEVTRAQSRADRRRWAEEEDLDFDPDEFDEFDAIQNTFIGIGDLRSAAWGLSLDRPEAIVDIRNATIIPRKDGIIALTELEGAPYTPPAFIPASAVGAGRILFDFPRLPDTLLKAASSLPKDQAQEATTGLLAGMMVARPILTSMGRELHLAIVRPPAKPPAPDDENDFNPGLPFMLGQSMPFFLAIELTDPTPLIDVVTGFGPQIGLKPRDFQGATIFEMEDMGVEVGLAIGHGYALIGAPTTLEDAIRALVNPGPGTLAQSPRFQRAIRTVDARGMTTGYINTRLAVDWLYDNIAETIADETDESPWQAALPPREVWLETVGDIVFSQSSVEQGFTASIRLLAPVQDP